MVIAFQFHHDQVNFYQMSPTCKRHGQQVISDSTLQLLMSSPQIMSVPWASLLWPWQITMCERIKVNLWLIRFSKSYFLAALLPQSHGMNNLCLWPNSWPISESLFMLFRDNLPILRQASSFPLSSVKDLTACFLPMEVSSQRIQTSSNCQKRIFIPFIFVGIPPSNFPTHHMTWRPHLLWEGTKNTGLLPTVKVVCGQE